MSMNPPLAVLPLLALVACTTIADGHLRSDAAALFGRIEGVSMHDTPEIALGRALFWDTRLSADGKTACASCHPASAWGADPRRFSPDARGELTSRQSPTIFNASLQPALRWLGDRKDLAQQAEGSLTGSMGFASKDAGVARMNELNYAAAFRAAYPGVDNPVTAVNYGRAIAAYEATLSTPAPFDRFLAGDDSALSAKQQAGLRAFITTGCTACHNGPLLGGRMFQKFGLVKDYWLETGSEKHDIGREAVTKQTEDRYVFRVPMLRNVARTAPYFHDGSVGEARPCNTRHGGSAARQDAGRCDGRLDRRLSRFTDGRSAFELRAAVISACSLSFRARGEEAQRREWPGSLVAGAPRDDKRQPQLVTRSPRP